MFRSYFTAAAIALAATSTIGVGAAVVEKSGCVEGTVTVLAKHSTVGVMLNEFEERFVSLHRAVFPPKGEWHIAAIPLHAIDLEVASEWTDLNWGETGLGTPATARKIGVHRRRRSSYTLQL